METPPTPRQPKPRRRLALIALGGVGALAAGLGVAWILVGGGHDTPAPSSSEGGLVIDSSDSGEGKIDPAKPLRCFVQGKYVGELSLSDCAQRNGVATDALDMGIGQSGAPQAGSPAVLPLPPPADAAAAPPPQESEGVPDDAALPVASDDSCWRHGGAGWRQLGAEMDLNACVQALYAGRCARADVSYGRWGSETLRLVPGRVEISDDNRNFRPLTLQAPDCSVDPIG